MKEPFVVHLISGLGMGGAENVLLQVARGLAERGFKQTIVSMSEGGVLREKFLDANIEVKTLPVQKISDLLKLSKDLNRIFQPHDGSKILQSWMYHADFANAIYSFLNRDVTTLWNIRHSSAQTAKSKTQFLQRINGVLSWFAPDKIICCADSAKEHHIRLGYAPEKIRVIYNGVDTHRFKAVSNEVSRNQRRQLGLPEEATIVGFLGRFNPQKNHLGLLKSIAPLLHEEKNMLLALAGPDVDHGNNQLCQLIEELKIQKQVRLLGPQNNPEIYFQTLDIHIMPSIEGEGFPNVVAESMSCGIPNLVTDCGDAAMIVGDRDCLLESKGGLLPTLNKKIKNSLAQNPQELRDRILINFSIEKTVEAYSQIYSLE